MSSAIEKAQAAMRARREAGETIIRLNPLERAARKPTSLRLALNAKCFDCQGGDADAGWRKRIRECAVTKCPLNPVRPYQADEGDDGEPEEAEPQA